MNDEKVIIKQIANPDNPNVGVKYVNAKEYLTAKVGNDGKFITGIDENALEIVQLQADKFKTKQAEVKKKRESLEKVLGKDLTPNSPFWDDFVVILEDELTLDPTNPLDQLTELFLVANGYVAPSLDAITEDDRYHNAMFFIFREQEEITKKAKKNQVLDKATSQLINLNESNPHKLKTVAAYIFGFDADIDLSVESAYERLREFISNNDEGVDQMKNIQKFNEVVSKKPEELIIKQLLDKAVKKKIVSSRGGKYRRGEELYGDTYEDALEFLGLAENSGEVSFLKKSLS